MNQFKILILLAAICVSALPSLAQKSAKEKVEFNYVQLPIEPIDPSFTTFNPVVVVGYAAEEAAKKEQYEAEKKAAKEEYAKEQKEYKDKSLGKKLLEKTLLDEGKPKQDVVEKPTFKPTYDVDALARTYLKLEGYEVGESSTGILYEVTLEGLQSTDPVIKSSSYKNKEGQTIYEFWYEVEYNYPMTVKVVAGTDELMNEMPKQFETTQTYTTKKYSSSSALRKALSPNSVMRAVDNLSLKTNLNAINRMVNERFGFMEKSRRTVVYTGKGRKLDYSDLTKAYIAVEQGLVDYKNGNTDGKIKEAIAIWNAAVEEADMDNKKARISRDVVFGLYLNLIEYNVLIADYKAAKNAINQILMMNPSKSEERKLDTYRSLYDSWEERYAANNE